MFNFIKKYILIFVVLCFLQSIFAQGEREFPFPYIPDMIVEPQQRASWLLSHYWDNVDFANANIVADTSFIEQSFVNFLSIIPIIEDAKAIESGVKQLMDKAEIDIYLYRRFMFLAEKYLYEPNSPMVNDEYYIYFLQQINSSSILSAVDKSRTEYLYKIVTKNRVGSQAVDFSFITSQKELLTLYSIKADELILVFYDPECEHCAEIINKLKDNVELNNKILSGKTKVLAVYPDGDRILWEKSHHQMPNNWIIAFASSPIQPIGKYVFRALPSIYVLDKNKKVIVKDITTL